MKYFKPELLARCRSLDDDTAEAAADGWERAVTAYNAKLATIRRELPPGARFILDHFSLHDASLFGITVSRANPWVSLFVRLEGTPARPGTDWELKYILAKGPKHRQLSIDHPRNDTKVLARIHTTNSPRLPTPLKKSSRTRFCFRAGSSCESGLSAYAYSYSNERFSLPLSRLALRRAEPFGRFNCQEPPVWLLILVAVRAPQSEQ